MFSLVRDRAIPGEIFLNAPERRLWSLLSEDAAGELPEGLRFWMKGNGLFKGCFPVPKLLVWLVKGVLLNGKSLVIGVSKCCFLGDEVSCSTPKPKLSRALVRNETLLISSTASGWGLLFFFILNGLGTRPASTKLTLFLLLLASSGSGL